MGKIEERSEEWGKVLLVSSRNFAGILFILFLMKRFGRQNGCA
jgi:hypothetical protein